MIYDYSAKKRTGFTQSFSGFGSTGFARS